MIKKKINKGIEKFKKKETEAEIDKYLERMGTLARIQICTFIYGFVALLVILLVKIFFGIV